VEQLDTGLDPDDGAGRDQLRDLVVGQVAEQRQRAEILDAQHRTQ
jgi:hypothetical protein